MPNPMESSASDACEHCKPAAHPKLGANLRSAGRGLRSAPPHMKGGSQVADRNQRKVVLGSTWMRTHVIVSDSALFGNARPKQRGNYLYQRDAVDPVIRRSILYFDDVVRPKSNIFSDNIPGFEVLEEQGYIQRSEVEIPPQKPGTLLDPYILSLINEFSFRALDKEEPNTFVFAPLVEHTPWWTPEIEQGVEKPSDSTKELEGVLFELYDALPVPAPDVNYADILDFKSRRADLLDEMRAHLDQLYQDIATSHDFPHARNTVLERLDKSIDGVARTMGEFGLKGTWQSAGMELLFDLSSGVGLSAKGAALLGVDATIGAVVGSGAGLYRFAKKNFQSPVERAGPLAFLVRAAQERVIELPKKS